MAYQDTSFSPPITDIYLTVGSSSARVQRGALVKAAATPELLCSIEGENTLDITAGE